MFSDVGWGEIFLLFIVGLVVIGPERLPRVIQDVKAALLAARTAINNAKEGLSNEIGPEFDDIRKPLSDLAALRGLGPKAALTKTLLDGDGSFLDSLDPKKILDDDTPAQRHPQQSTAQHPSTAHNPKDTAGEKPGGNNGQESTGGGGFSWADIT